MDMSITEYKVYIDSPEALLGAEGGIWQDSRPRFARNVSIPHSMPMLYPLLCPLTAKLTAKGLKCPQKPRL